MIKDASKSAEKIPFGRMVTYILLGGLLPLILVGLYFVYASRSLNQLSHEIEYTRLQAVVSEQRQATNMAVRQHYQQADHFYIDKYLESMTFLEPEVESIQKVLSNPNFAGDETLRKRLELLTSNTNQMVFTEGVVQSAPHFQETTETLVRPIEVNGQDLQRILANIEGTTIGDFTPSPDRPQLIILDFKLDRKAHSEQHEVLFLNLKLLKREYP